MLFELDYLREDSCRQTSANSELLQLGHVCGLEISVKILEEYIFGSLSPLSISSFFFCLLLINICSGSGFHLS